MSFQSMANHIYQWNSCLDHFRLTLLWTVHSSKYKNWQKIFWPTSRTLFGQTGPAWAMPKWSSIFFSGTQTNYSKWHTTVVLCIDTAQHVSNESKMQNWNVTWCNKLFFSKLALLVGVWQKKKFTKLERRVKQRYSLFRKHSLFKTQMWSLFFYVFSKNVKR